MISAPLFTHGLTIVLVTITIVYVYFIAELKLGRQADHQMQEKKQHAAELKTFMGHICLIVSIGFVTAFITPLRISADNYPYLLWSGIALMLLGSLIRGWSIRSLGEYFTYCLDVSAQQSIIDKGPYQYVRHPAYTATLFMNVGVAFCFGSLISIAIIFSSSIYIFSRRIKFEESLLIKEKGAAYQEYAAKRKRLIPLVY